MRKIQAHIVMYYQLRFLYSYEKHFLDYQKFKQKNKRINLELDIYCKDFPFFNVIDNTQVPEKKVLNQYIYTVQICK